MQKVLFYHKLRKIYPCILFNSNIKSNLEYYGGDIEELCKKYNFLLKIFLSLISLITLLAILKIKILLFLDIPLALLTYFYPLLYSWSKKEEFKKLINLEAPFISIVAYVNSIVDKSLVYTMKELSEIKELKTPKIEFQLLDKMMKYMGFSTINAIEKRAEIHSGDLLGKLYNNYIAAINLGITVRDRLRDVLKDILFDLKESYKGYVEKSAELAEVEFAVLLLLPIVLIGFAFTFKVSIIELLFPLVFIPPLLFVITTLQPGINYEIKYGKILYGLVLIPLILILQVNVTYKIVSILTILLILSYFTYQQVSLANELEKSLPIILKELSVYLRIGYTVQNALPKIRMNSKRVNKVLNDVIKNPEDISTPSKLFNMTMKLLFLLSKTGSSSNALEELGNAIAEILYSKESLMKQLRLYDALVFLTPIMLWLSFTTLNKIINSIIPEIDIIALYTVGSALLLSKLSRFTILYFPTMVMITVILIILSFIPPVFL